MKTIIIIILTILIILALIAMTYILLYNKIDFLRIKINEAEDVIIKELQNRYDLIMKCKKTIEKNTKMDLSIFTELENTKKSNISTYDFERKLTGAIATIYLITNDYPKLEEKKDFKENLRKLNESDNKIIAAKSFYNKNTNNLNSLIKKFPTNIICLIHKIKSKTYYDAKEIFNENDDLIKI